MVVSELRFRRLWLLGGLCLALVVAIGSLLPGKDLPDVQVSDKFLHVAAFLVLAFWFGSIMVRSHYPWIALALMAYGALIELAQAWMSAGRHPEMLDLVADAGGIAGGLLLAFSPAGRWAGWCDFMLRKAVS